MKVIADGQRRVKLPDPVRAGDVFDVALEPGGRLILTKLKRTNGKKVRLVRKDGLLLLSSPKTITWEQTRKAMDELT